MRAIALVALAGAAAVCASTALADRDDPAQHVLRFEGTRTRAEVFREAVEYATTHADVAPEESRAQPVLRSELDRDSVRREAADATRRGLTPRGEAG